MKDEVKSKRSSSENTCFTRIHTHAHSSIKENLLVRERKEAKCRRERSERIRGKYKSLECILTVLRLYRKDRKYAYVYLFRHRICLAALSTYLMRDEETQACKHLNNYVVAIFIPATKECRLTSKEIPITLWEYTLKIRMLSDSKGNTLMLSESKVNNKIFAL